MSTLRENLKLKKNEVFSKHNCEGLFADSFLTNFDETPHSLKLKP